MKNKSSIALIAIIAGLYTVFTLSLLQLSFNFIQIRLSEVLIVVVLSKKEGIWGMTIGCLISNILSMMMGISDLGIIDAVVGTSATYIAAVLAYKFRDLTINGTPYVSLLMPVIINAIILPFMFLFVIHQQFILSMYLFYFASIFIGQFISCVVVGRFVYHKTYTLLNSI